MEWNNIFANLKLWICLKFVVCKFKSHHYEIRQLFGDTKIFVEIISELAPLTMQFSADPIWCFITLSSFQLQANLLILDDITDGSTTRRGQPCWYRNKDIGLTAVNDALLIQESLYHNLKKYFSHLECYSRLMEAFHDVSSNGRF